MSISTDITDDGREVTIKISGRFDFSRHQEFRTAFEKSSENVDQFRVDMGATEYIDSSALGMLLVLREKVGGNKDNVKIVNARPEVKKILTIANFHQLFTVA